MQIDFTLADKVTAFLRNETTKQKISRDQVYHLLVRKGLIHKDGSATKYAKKEHLLDF